ncbi:MAG: alpha-galactosidase, partial [Planctomycetota bacterium]
PGEGLRQNVEGVRQIFRRMRERFPELVIKNCSSGGQRAEPAFGRLADMHSFSDAHTCKDIPVVAGNMARMIPSEQNQIWSVLRPDENKQRLLYSLAAAFIGRMCLSGEIWKLDAGQMQLVREAIELYTDVAPIIRDGEFTRFGTWSPSRRHLTGWQAVTHTTDEHRLAIIHRFGAGSQPDSLPVSSHDRIEHVMATEGTEVKVEGGELCIHKMAPWSGGVVLLTSQS